MCPNLLEVVKLRLKKGSEMHEGFLKQKYFKVSLMMSLKIHMEVIGSYVPLIHRFFFLL